MRLVFALLLCLVPATTFAAPIQLNLSGTVTSEYPQLPFVDVGDAFSASLTYNIPVGPTRTTVTGFLYFKQWTWTFTDSIFISNGLPAEEIFTEFNGLAPYDDTINPPRVYAPGRFSLVFSTSTPGIWWARLGFFTLGIPSQFDATGTITAVPEPATIGLLATGLAIGFARRLRKSRASH